MTKDLFYKKVLIPCYNNDLMAYTDTLPQGISLQVFNGNSLIFQSSGKWLHPLFELEDFLKTYDGPKDDLRSHDTAIGKAAALLSIRCGIKKINAELLSQNAKTYIDEVNLQLDEGQKIELSWTNLIPKLMCATENQLEDLHDSDQMYFLLRQRARKVQGLDLCVQGLTHSFGHINNLSFEVKAGGHLMICGENGAGKTTLLRLIAGVYKIEKGKILIDGKTPGDLEKYTIGYIPQFTDKASLSLSVEEVVGLGVKAKKADKEKIISNSLCRTCSCDLAKRSFNSLSGGEKQKVQLSRCLAQNAKVLLLDEPTASLDAENKEMVINILRSLTISEIPTIIVVTHDKELTKMPGWDKLYLGEENAR